MMLIRFVVVLPMLLLGGLGNWTSARPCNEFICKNTCIVDNSCEPVIERFNKECDDPYWDDVGLESPQAEELCTQCCDKHCQAVQTFPNCTGETCNQCYEESSGGNSSETYDMHCCEIDGQLRCSLCTTPSGWNADWTSEIESKLPDGAVFSFGDDALCGDVPYEGECATGDVNITFAGESCKLTRDIKCSGWYYSERAPACKRCIPRWNKVQLISSSFERRTIQCKTGEAATCEKIPSRIVDVSIQCPKPNPSLCELGVSGAFSVLEVSVEDGQNNLVPGSSFRTSSSFSLEVYPPEVDEVTKREVSTSFGGLTIRTSSDSAPDFTDPGTGQQRDYTVCQLSLTAYAIPGSSATVDIENFLLEIPGKAPINLGNFSHDSSETSPSVWHFCRDDYGQNFRFDATFVILRGNFSETGTQWTAEVKCGTTSSECPFMSR